MTTTAPNTTMPDVDEFRARARAWLAENAERLTSGGVVNRMQSREHRIAIYDAGFGGITWPVEYGGLGLTGAHQEAFTEEAAKYPDLVVGDLVTAGICAPTLLDFGSEEQKRRYIPHMLRGDEVWTQLLSEPGAGSDLAGLQTQSGPRRRRVGRQRAEGLDVGRDGERVRHPHRPQQPRCPQAPGPVDVHGRPEGARRHHPPAASR